MANLSVRNTTTLLYLSLVVIGALAGALLTVLLVRPGGGLGGVRPTVEVVQLTSRPSIAMEADSLRSGRDFNTGQLNQVFKDVSAAVRPSVVFIEVESSGGGFFHRFEGGVRLSAGSGVIVSENGYVVTNHHVIEDAADIHVTLSDKREYSAEVIGDDPNTDLAVIRLDGAEELPSIVLGDANSIEVGEWVMAVGNPFRLTSTVTAGIVSAIGRQVNIIDDDLAIENFIQTDAAINPGNSGGALVNLRGELVGIATAIATESGSYEGYGFAVPVDLMQRVVADLVEYGAVERGYLGVTIEAVDASRAEDLGLDRVRGVYLRDVREGMASWNAGLRPGDVLVAIDGRTVDEPNALQGAIALYRPGDLVRTVIWRDGKEIEVPVRLFGREDARASEWFAELDSRTLAPDDIPAPDLDSPRGQVETFDGWGFGVVGLSSRIAGAFDVEEGAYVMFVERGGLADAAGLPRNTVIVSVDGERISGVAALRSMLGRADDAGSAVILEIVRRDGTSAFFEIGGSVD